MPSSVCSRCGARLRYRQRGGLCRKCAAHQGIERMSSWQQELQAGSLVLYFVAVVLLTAIIFVLVDLIWPGHRVVASIPSLIILLLGVRWIWLSWRV
ncbi:MAG: hypothetical protein HC837_16890 [Chloroflexaceae bacterium]|nr:hypothetical protein [Chloroflexaceae bacterium]